MLLPSGDQEAKPSAPASVVEWRKALRGEVGFRGREQDGGQQEPHHYPRRRQD